MLYSLSLTAYVNHLPVLLWVNELVRMFPSPFLLTFFHAPVIDITNNAACRYPHNGSDDYHSTHYIIFQETHNFIDIYIFDDVPKSFHYVLDCLLTYALKKNMKEFYVS